MEAARRPRGRLSRRRPPAGGEPIPGDRARRSPPPRSRTPPRRRPWFLLGGSDSEPWAAVLRTAWAALTPDGEPVPVPPVPPLPAFPAQEPSPGLELAQPPEVFTVGPTTFSWTPFPPAPEGLGSSSPLVRGAGDPLKSPTPSLKGTPAPAPCETPTAHERSLSLQSCPMCQKEFDPTLTQLDVDSHLAQCLAESTEDVAW